MKTTKLEELAIAQFIGWQEHKSSNNIIHLIESMNLSKKEWLRIRDQVEFLSENEIEEINNHFD